MRRRRRRNPVLGGFGLPLAILAVAGVGAFVLLKKKPRVALTGGGGDFSTTPLLTTGLRSFDGFLAGDCILAIQGQAGFSVGGGVPQGDATPMRIVQAGSNTVRAESIDSRVAPGSVFTVPAAAVTNGGDCSVGFA